MLKRILVTVGVLLLALILGGAWWVRRNDQYPDESFATSVARPAYPPRAGPRVAIDAAHHNFHTADKRYQPFAALLSSDGYRVSANERDFSRDALASVEILVVATALGAPIPQLPSAKEPAFSDTECDAVRDWVRAGGTLLLIADHAPASLAAQRLAQRFGVELGVGRTADTAHMVAAQRNPTWVVFERAAGLLGDHAILRGRDTLETIRRVVAFTGQSMTVPSGTAVLLPLSPTAQDWMPDGRDVPATGRAMAIAFPFGNGRIVMAGEAAMFTAQVVGGSFRYGMNWPDTDDKQFALNVVHWLSGALH